jgi:hypothetical protein
MIILGRNVFKLLPDLIEGGLILIDDLSGAVQAFDTPDSKRDCPEGDPIFFISQFATFYILGGASKQDAKEGFFIPELPADIIIQTFYFRTRKGVGIETMLESIGVAARGARLSENQRRGGDDILSRDSIGILGGNG